VCDDASLIQEVIMRLRHAATAVLMLFWWTGVAGAQTGQPSAEYKWAGSCKDCHAAQYKAWSETKHARAITRLSAAERESDTCARCHVTGGKTLAADSVNANVQCEECHGPGGAHMQGDPQAITRKPAEKVCVQCHSEASPKFKYFSYAAMSPLVHPVKK
jgi:predicted CXXCH cytochrome family protein